MSERTPRYLVIAVGTAGDIYPSMWIATALQSLGRNIVFITNSFHAKLVIDAGLPFVGLGTGEEYLRIITDPDLWHPRRGFAALMANYGKLLRQIDDAIRHACRPERNVAIVQHCSWLSNTLSGKIWRLVKKHQFTDWP
ncbi:MAG TPA: glycosyltransferase [Paucimonas sp.]|nr:glycosyltransferase [Paucimonas sp.]